MATAPMNPGQARVVDPVLTTIGRSYRHAAHCWPYLFPAVPVPARGGQIITFGAEDFVKRDLRRAPGSNRQRLNVGYVGEKYGLEQRALDGVVPFELLQDSMAVPGISLGRRATTQVMANLSLQVEIEAAELATDVANYDAGHREALAGAGQWSHPDSKPSAKVNDAKQVVREGIGLVPNTLAVGYEVWLALQNNADVVERTKHTRGPSESMPQVTKAMMAGYFDVDHFVVCEAMHGAPGEFADIWGKNAVLAYTDTSSLAQAEGGDMGSPSFGYTYRLEGYPIVEEPWRDRNADCWLYPATTEDTPVIAGKAGGFLFTAVVA